MVVGGAWKSAALMCVGPRSSSVRPTVRLTVTLPDRKNRPIQGVALSGIVGGVIFITFTKARRGRRWAGGMLFPAVDTGLDHFFFLLRKTARSKGRRPIWSHPLPNPPSPRLAA